MVPAIVHKVSEELPVPPQPRPWLLMAACWRLLLVAPSGATAYMDFSRPEIESMCNMPFRWYKVVPCVVLGCQPASRSRCMGTHGLTPLTATASGSQGPQLDDRLPS